MVNKIFEEKNKDLELLLPPVTETEKKPKSKFLTRSESETERQAYFKGDGIRRGYDIEVKRFHLSIVYRMDLLLRILRP